jgi:Cys-tRNA(Pro)/Cys-tRNA(Cys) deacylase
MGRVHKTLAMRVLEEQGVSYEVVVFPDTIHDALEVARYAGLPPEMVYKTLVVEAEDTNSKPFLFLVAATRTLNLKKAARAVGARKLRMARHVDAERLTGLKVGGISALALLNKGFAVYLDEWAILLDEIVVSAGERGLNLRLRVDDLIRVTSAQLVDVSEEQSDREDV